MSWNYRLVRRYYIDALDKTEKSFVAMTETYYTKDGSPSSFTMELRAPSCADDEVEDAVASIRWALNRQMEALDKPILDERADFSEEAINAEM